MFMAYKNLYIPTFSKTNGNTTVVCPGPTRSNYISGKFYVINTVCTRTVTISANKCTQYVTGGKEPSGET